MEVTQTYDDFARRIAELTPTGKEEHNADVLRFAAIGVLPLYEGSVAQTSRPSTADIMTGKMSGMANQVSDQASAQTPLGASGPTKRVIPWGATVSREFVDSVLWIEGQIGLRAENLMPCMKFESNLNPQAHNPGSSATGLIQFMDATAKRLGTTTALLARMDAVKQLSYVYKYFKEYHDRGFKLDSWTLGDTYMSILWPAGIGKDDDYVVFDKAKGYASYSVNRGLDNNNDGHVSKAEACKRVLDLFIEGSSSKYGLRI